ncbi:MAG: hypothetical protein NVSMB47_17660 [Polyangiales bacterium]
MSPPTPAVAPPRESEPVSSPPLRVLRPRRAAPDTAVRPTRAEVDLSALRYNLRVVRKAAGSARVWAVLKADGYGHGAPAVARTLERAGVDGLAVALLEEAIELRTAGIRAPILVMGGYYGAAYDELLTHDLVPVVYDASHFEGLARAMRERGIEGRAKVHLKIDTGMARLGVSLDGLDAVLAVAAGFPQVELDGVMTHGACADVAGDDAAASVAGQLAQFRDGLARVRAAGHRPRFVHAANSAATRRSSDGAGVAAFDARFAAVRSSIASSSRATARPSTPARSSVRATAGAP